MYYQLNIIANKQQQEELIAFLSEAASGFEQTDTELIAYYEEDNFPETVQSIIKPYQHTTKIVEEKNWNEEWEKNFEPVVVDDFCYVRADFHKPVMGVTHEIIITPKMSFGTGHHATTYMMIEQMKSIDFTNKLVFDFGTGTGILAILAEKLGAKNVVAIDNDSWSVENAKENCEKNSCSQISVALSDKIPTQEFDVILANINKNVILQFAHQLVSRLTQDGCMLLSGLLSEDNDEIINTFTSDRLIKMKTMQKDNWISLLFVNANQEKVN